MSDDFLFPMTTSRLSYASSPESDLELSPGPSASLSLGNLPQLVKSSSDPSIATNQDNLDHDREEMVEGMPPPYTVRDYPWCVNIHISSISSAPFRVIATNLPFSIFRLLVKFPIRLMVETWINESWCIFVFPCANNLSWIFRILMITRRPTQDDWRSTTNTDFHRRSPPTSRHFMAPDPATPVFMVKVRIPVNW